MKTLRTLYTFIYKRPDGLTSSSHARDIIILITLSHHRNQRRHRNIRNPSLSLIHDPRSSILNNPTPVVMPNPLNVAPPNPPRQLAVARSLAKCLGCRCLGSHLTGRSLRTLHCLLQLRRYKAKCVKTCCLQEGVGHFEPRFHGERVVTLPIY